MSLAVTSQLLTRSYAWSTFITGGTHPIPHSKPEREVIICLGLSNLLKHA